MIKIKVELKKRSRRRRIEVEEEEQKQNRSRIEKKIISFNSIVYEFVKQFDLKCLKHLMMALIVNIR